MIIRIYRTGVASQVPILIITAVILWLDAFIHPQPPAVTAENTPLYQLISGFFYDAPLILNVIIAFLILLVQAFILNQSVSEHKVLPRSNLLIALIYVALMSYTPDILRITPVLLSNLFLVITFYILLNIYSKTEPLVELFMVGFFISLASLCYLPSAIFLLLIYLSCIVYRISSTREWFVPMVGFLAPYLFIIIFYFWFDKLPFFYTKYILFFSNIQSFDFTTNTIYYIFGGLVSLLTIIAIGKVLLIRMDILISQRKMLIILLYSILISVITYIYAGNFSPVHVAVSFIPMSILIAVYFIQSGRILLIELYFTLLILLIFASKVIFYFKFL